MKDEEVEEMSIALALDFERTQGDGDSDMVRPLFQEGCRCPLPRDCISHYVSDCHRQYEWVGRCTNDSVWSKSHTNGDDEDVLSMAVGGDEETKEVVLEEH